LVDAKGYRLSLLPVMHEESCSQEKDGAGYSCWVGATLLQDAVETINSFGGEQIDLLVVDHYALDFRWRQKIGLSARRVLVVDDLANRQLDCDLIVDPTFGRLKDDYNGLVAGHTELLLGSEYALLRKEFSEFRNKSKRKRGSTKRIKKVLVSLGGGDVEDLTLRVLQGLDMIQWKTTPEIDVVMGFSPQISSLFESKIGSLSLDINIYSSVSNMAQLMYDADVSVGAGGGASWERCCLGLPAILIVSANNQSQVAANLSAIGASIVIKETDDLPSHIGLSLQALIDDNVAYQKFSSIASMVCDGKGAQRVADRVGA
jgi:UDP-2,4-diacetamido-2,4,6-trideoxy-beta-L-altropyranose hydrolase